jgi:hypothetical protein
MPLLRLHGAYRWEKSRDFLTPEAEIPLIEMVEREGIEPPDPGIMSAVTWLSRLNRDPIVDPKSLITLNF